VAITARQYPHPPDHDDLEEGTGHAELGDRHHARRHGDLHLTGSAEEDGELLRSLNP
jgi:hypothetical protein